MGAGTQTFCLPPDATLRRVRDLLDAFDRCEPGLGAVVVNRDGELRKP